MQMKRKISYRLAHIFLVLLGVSFLSFLLMYVSPGDPVRAMYAVSGSIPSEEVLEQTREELGLNDPFFIQYGNWISNCLRGDFGTSYSKGEAVATLLMERVMPTIQLALLSLVIMVLVAVPIGVYSLCDRTAYWTIFCGVPHLSAFPCLISGWGCCCSMWWP